MALREIDKARKRFFAAMIAAMGQRRIANRRNQIGPGVRRTRPKPGRYGHAGFCSGKQERARRARRN